MILWSKASGKLPEQNTNFAQNNFNQNKLQKTLYLESNAMLMYFQKETLGSLQCGWQRVVFVETRQHSNICLVNKIEIGLVKPVED